VERVCEDADHKQVDHKCQQEDQEVLEAHVLQVQARHHTRQPVRVVTCEWEDASSHVLITVERTSCGAPQKATCHIYFMSDGLSQQAHAMEECALNVTRTRTYLEQHQLPLCPCLRP
jgi:hypothetical protein